MWAPIVSLVRWIARRRRPSVAWLPVGIVLLVAGGVAAQGTPSGEYGQIPVGGSVKGTIAAATSDRLVYHTYVVEVPPGSGPITIRVDGMGSDLDLAVNVGAPISDYTDVDFIDTSDLADPAYTTEASPIGPVYVDVLNLLAQPASYAVSVSETLTAPVPSGPPSPIGPNGEAMPSGEYGPVDIGSSVEGAIDAADAYSAFHTFWIDVPQSGTDLTISVDGMGSDLDIALKIGVPITDYEDVDYIDTSEDPDPVVELRGAAAGRIFVDVMNLLAEPARYRLTVVAGTDGQARTAPDGSRRNTLEGDALTGSFDGDGLQVIVSGASGSYSGELVLNGRRFPFQASGAGNRLDGTFTSDSQTFTFSATLEGNMLRVKSGGRVYHTMRVSGGAPEPVNPLAPDDGSSRPQPASPEDDPVLAEAPYGTMTLDNAHAFFEALVFAHQQVGFAAELSEQELDQYVSAMAQAYPTFTPDEQLALSMSREIWSRVQANWADAAPQDQQEFVIGMLALWYGDEQVTQWFASTRGAGGGDGQAGACDDIDTCFSQYASPETYSDAMNAQSCWAAAGCTDYDPSYNEFTYEDYSYGSSTDY